MRRKHKLAGGSKKLVTASVVLGLTAGLFGPLPTARAQDFPPPPDFGDSPPPPPPPDFGDQTPVGGDTDSSPATADSGSGSAEGTGGMTKAQQDKFNRSGIEDITKENFPETIESFDFPNVELADIIKTISELTGKNFIIDPGVRGKITIIAPSKITVAEAYKAFLSALAINGYTVVPSGSFLKVKNARNAQRDSIETYSGAYYPNDDQMITRIIHLKHISAEILNRELRILTSKDGEMSIYSPTNSIILSDYGSNIDRVMKIINQLDVPGFEEQIEVVRIRYAKAKDMAELIDKIVNKGQKSSTASPAGTFTSGVPRFTRSAGTNAANQSGNASFMAIPDDRTNHIIVVGNRAGIARVKKLVAQLDFHMNAEDTGGVFVYYVKYGDAEKIAQILQGVTKEAAPKPATGSSGPSFPNFGFGAPGAGASANAAGAEIFGGDVKVTADKGTNSLIVVASKTDYDQVLRLLGKIDIPRDQVYVEAVIMEMALTDATDWKVGYYQYGPTGYGKVGFNGGVPINDLLSPTGGSGAVIGFGQGKTVNVTDPISKQTLAIPNLVGFINFLKTNKRVNVLSTPQVTALDNEEALIEVGDKVATSVQTTTGTNGVATQQATFEDATIKLKLKPFIGKQSNTIRMEIDQSVKQPGVAQGPKAIQESTLALQTRTIKTHIVVNDGDTAILGGLMNDRDSEDVSKVPVLGDLPIIGWLFKSRTVSKVKVNLVVFLTPKILRSPADSNQIISQKLDERLEFVKGAGGRDPYGAKVDQIERAMARKAGTPAPILDGPLLNANPPANDPYAEALKSAPAPTGPATSPTPPPPPTKAEANPPATIAPPPSTDEAPLVEPDLEFNTDENAPIDPALTE